jgi:hypothetical protein
LKKNIYKKKKIYCVKKVYYIIKQDFRFQKGFKKFRKLLVGKEIREIKCLKSCKELFDREE